MKQSIVPSLSFYFYIVIYFSVNFLNLEACNYVRAQELFADNQLLDVFTTLRIVKKMHRDVQDQHDQIAHADQLNGQDFLIDIMIILVGMYEKIVAATVTHYLLINLPVEENLQNIVAKIIAEDVVKIISILGNQAMLFLFNKEMTWQEKILNCFWVSSIIIIIKFGIDQIPFQADNTLCSDEKNKPNSMNSLPNGVESEHSSVLDNKFGYVKK